MYYCNTTRELLRSGKDVAVTIFSDCFLSIEYDWVHSWIWNWMDTHLKWLCYNQPKLWFHMVLPVSRDMVQIVTLILDFLFTKKHPAWDGFHKPCSHDWWCSRYCFLADIVAGDKWWNHRELVDYAPAVIGCWWLLVGGGESVLLNSNPEYIMMVSFGGGLLNLYSSNSATMAWAFNRKAHHQGNSVFAL